MNRKYILTSLFLGVHLTESILFCKSLHVLLRDEEDVLESDVIVPLPGESVVPPEIKRWLMLTFSTSGMGECILSQALFVRRT